ncbi:MAG: branched-chain amino acid ABC transporter permease [Candidatus Caldarchaeum sp.]
MELLGKSLLLALPLGLLLYPLLRRLPLAFPLALLLGGLLGALLHLLLSPGVLAYLVSFAVFAGIFALLSLGLNVHWGYTGLFNIGVAGFFALGAFTSALFTTAMPQGILALYSQQAFGLEQPFLVGVLAGGLVALLFALPVGLATLRLREDYLAIATIGFAELVRLVFQNERWLANGPEPLRGIPRPLYCLVQGPDCDWLPAFLAPLFAGLEPPDYPYVFLLLLSIALALSYLLLERALRSPWGRVLRAVREDEVSAQMLGKNTALLKLQAFAVGAFLMGVAGAFYAHYMVSIDYNHFQPLFATFLIWVMLILGGSGNNRGAILGAFVIWGVWTGTAFLTDLLSPLLQALSPDLPARGPYLRYLFIALLFILILLYRPRGLLGEEKVVSVLGRRD